MKRIAVILLLALLILAGCGRKETPAEPAPTAEAPVVSADETAAPSASPAAPDPVAYAPTGT